jgi:hypothetical protein
MWFYSYRNDEGYVAAAVTGLVLSEPAIASVISPEVTDQPLSLRVVLLFFYLSFSNFGYAIANWARSRRSWLDL